MRADRLIALLLLLQRRGKITAAEAADELEVSTRTARRDLEALAASGVPIYSTAGRGGGWQLIGGASTDLSGLSMDEARAVFLAAGPTVADRPELRSALRKLTSALPQPFQAEAEAAGSALKVDHAGWGQVGVARGPRFIDELTDAVVGGRVIRLDYQGRDSERRTRTVHPLGLVTKRNVWYLVAGVETDPDPAPVDIRTYRVNRIHAVLPGEGEVRRPEHFDLERVWEGIVSEVQARREALAIQAIVDPDYLGALRWVFGSGRIRVLRASDDGWTSVELDASNARSFAGQIAGFGDRVRLVDPPTEVVDHLRAIAEELNELYEPRHTK